MSGPAQFIHDGVTLAWSHLPTKSGKPTLVFLSGWGFGHLMGQVALQEMHARGYGVFTLDVPGTGSLDEHSAFVYVARLARATAALLREQNLHEAVIVGHSFGSMIAQELALSEDDVVGKLVLISPLNGIGGMLPDLNAAMSMMSRLLSGGQNPFEILYTPLYLQDLKSRLGDLFADLERPTSIAAISGQIWAAGRWTNFGRLSALYQPLLIIQGKTDPLGALQQASWLAGTVPHADLRLVDAGYMPFLEEPGATFNLIESFLK